MNRNSNFSPPDVYDYHVGWICAATQDYGAACKVLDEQYQPLTSSIIPSSRTSYKLGRIGNHNVVINIPPSDSSIELLPLNVARSLIAQFPSIRFFLVAGCGGAIDMTEDSVALGDVVIGTKVVPCNVVGNRTNSGSGDKMFTPPEYLLSALTVAFDERGLDQSNLQQSMNAVIKCIPNYNGRYRRPGHRLDHLSQGSTRSQQYSSQYRSEAEHQESQPYQSTTVFYGSIVSRPGNKTMDISGSLEQNTAIKDILCVESGSADILAAGISCLPIIGISSDVRDHGHRDSDWSHYAAFAAAVCSKEVLASLDPEVVTRADSNMTSKEVDAMMRDNAKVIQRYIQEACRYRQPDRLLEAARLADKRVDQLEVWIKNMSQIAQDATQEQLVNLKTEMDSIKETEDRMRQDLKVMNDKIEKLRNDPENANMRSELDWLHETVADHASRLDILSDFTYEATGITIKALDIVGQQTNNPGVQQANLWIKFVREQQEELSKFAGKMTWRSKRTKNTSSDAPRSGGGYSAPQELPQTQSKIGKFRPPAIFSRQHGAPAASSDIRSDERQHHKDPKPPHARITSVPSLSRSSSLYTAPRTPCSNFHNSNIGRTSVNTLGTQDYQDPKRVTPKIPVSGGHFSRSASFYTATGRQSSDLYNSSMSQTAVSPVQEHNPGSSLYSHQPLTRVDSQPRTRDLVMNRESSHTPSLQYQTVEPSTRSANGSEVDQASNSSVKKLAKEFEDRVGIMMGRPH